jgi:hypothetical protein
MNRKPLFCYAILSGMALLFCTDALAVDYGLSGFGTLGGAVSDKKIVYQRYIDDNGTLMRDSLVGIQLDVKFTDQWAATAQVVLAAATDEDDVLKPQLKWTLLSYRPTNDWLIRAGRLSFGGLLNQQNLDVGVTYDMARLPTEVYLLSSAYDFDGLSVAKTWSTRAYEITLDGTFGMQNRDYRAYDNGSNEPDYFSGDVTGGGFVVTVTDYDQAMYRAGWSINKIDTDEEGFLTTFNFISLGNGLYTLGRPDYGSSIRANTLFLGIRMPLGGFLISFEGTAVITQDVDPAPTTAGAYINISRKMGSWTPYLTYAQSWTDGLDTWRKVKGATAVPQLGVSQTTIDNAASNLAVFDQNSWMIGTSYAFTPKQKVKAEAMLTHVGDRSAMFDGDIANENVMVYSLSYNFSF